MTTNEYDVLHVEDDPFVWKRVESRAKALEITYLGVSTLQELQQALTTSRAQIYAVDGEFPEELNGVIDFNAEKAIAHIREIVGKEARVIIISSNMRILDTAERLRVHFLAKETLQDYGEIADRLKKMLKQSKI